MSVLVRMMIPVDELSTIFSDLAPVPQDDGPDPVCVIQYPTSFRLAYDYMRAVWRANELSERALRLTALCLKLNPANYTVWQYRRKILRSLGRSADKDAIAADLALSSSLGGTNPKNYQVWYHRRALLDEYPSLQQDFLDSELDYISTVLEEDSKNYHAWSNRQWLIAAVNQKDLWEKEVQYAQDLIQQDPRNNSAWNLRWFACHKGTKNPLSLEQCISEGDFAIQKGAKLDPFNESPWRYLVALLREQNGICDNTLYHEFEQKANNLRSVLTDAGRNPDTCACLTSARIDLLEMMGDPKALEMGKKLAQGLADEYDPIRKRYWMMRIDQMQKRK